MDEWLRFKETKRRMVRFILISSFPIPNPLILISKHALNNIQDVQLWQETTTKAFFGGVAAC